MDSDPDNLWLQLLILVFLTALNAFFAGAEMALVSVNPGKLSQKAEEGDKKAALVLELLQEPSRFLSTIQIVITLAGFFNSASAATGISKRLEVVLERIHIPNSDTLSVVIITLILSYFTLVLGELVPKRIAQQKAESFSMFVVRPVSVLSKITSPIVKLLSVSTGLVLRIFGMNDEVSQEKVSEAEIRALIENGVETGVFDEYESEMLDSVFEFDDILAKEIMTSRTDVYAIDVAEPLSSYLDEMLETRHSRIPVYEEDIDNIVGVLYLKDFILEARRCGFENVDIRSLLHKPYFVLESKNINELFHELQESRQYIAVLIDEYGGFSGIVTIEDLVEEVMGSIDDTGDDDDEPKIEEIDDHTWLLTGLVTINDLNDELDTELESESHDTVSGLLLDQLGYIPEENDLQTIELCGLRFDIQKIQDKRIEQILVTKLPGKDEEEEENKEE
ncbi:MAG: hemolysin family protein [Ruminococcus sp.]|jgi:putative hemolysin